MASSIFAHVSSWLEGSRNGCHDDAAATEAMLPPCRPCAAALCSIAFLGVTPAASRLSSHAPFPRQVDTEITFYASSAAGVVGALLTLVFLPDTTGLDLVETDRLHRFMLAGQVRWAAARATSEYACAPRGSMRRGPGRLFRPRAHRGSRQGH